MVRRTVQSYENISHEISMIFDKKGQCTFVYVSLFSFTLRYTTISTSITISFVSVSVIFHEPLYFPLLLIIVISIASWIGTTNIFEQQSRYLYSYLSLVLALFALEFRYLLTVYVQSRYFDARNILALVNYSNIPASNENLE